MLAIDMHERTVLDVRCVSQLVMSARVAISRTILTLY